MPRFRKKPVEIEAIQWKNNWGELAEFLGMGTHHVSRDIDTLKIETLEGTMVANDGDWIIRGVKGEIYPCKPDIFEATYDGVAAS